MSDPLSVAIIHDLRNPLASILTGAEMLTNLQLSPDHVRRLAHNLQQSAERMRELLAGLMEMTCGKSEAPERQNLHQLLSDVCEQTSVTADLQYVQIHLDVCRNMEVPMARARLEHVFTNLITNALEAMPCGGDIRIRGRSGGEHALIEVEDSGPGIPATILDRLFDPFVTAGKKNGLGLGLALARQTVRDHGGDMWVEPADGARFVIRLPLGPSERVQSATNPETRCTSQA